MRKVFRRNTACACQDFGPHPRASNWLPVTAVPNPTGLKKHSAAGWQLPQQAGAHKASKADKVQEDLRDGDGSVECPSYVTFPGPLEDVQEVQVLRLRVRAKARLPHCAVCKAWDLSLTFLQGPNMEAE